MPEYSLPALPALPALPGDGRAGGGAVATAPRLFVADLRRSPRQVDRLRRLLSPAERERCDGLWDAAGRRRYAVARALLRLRLAEETGRTADALRLRTGVHGRPELAGYPGYFNLSHTGDTAVLALADRPVGVDVEGERPELDVLQMAERWFPATEAAALRRLPGSRQHPAWLRLWTRKEACAKACGRRVFDGLAVPVAAVTGERWQLLGAHRSGAAVLGPWLLRDLAGLAVPAAVAVLTRPAAAVAGASTDSVPAGPRR